MLSVFEWMIVVGVSRLDAISSESYFSRETNSSLGSAVDDLIFASVHSCGLPQLFAWSAAAAPTVNAEFQGGQRRPA